MAYYNPDQANSYYDPYQNSQESTPSAISAIGNAAKSLMVIGGLNMAGGIVAKKVSGLLGRGIKAGVLGKNTKAYGLAQNLKNPSIGGILKQTSSAKAASRWFKGTAVGKANRDRAGYLKSIKGSTGAGVNRVLSAFKSPATLAGAVGGVWARTALAGAPVAYAVDSALGLTQDSLGLQKKALWDVPGQIGNAAKWFGYESLYATTFGALTPLAGASKSVAVKGLEKTFGGSMGKAAYKILGEVQGGSAIQKMADSSPLLKEQGFFQPDLLLKKQSSEQGKSFTSGVITKALKIGMSIRDVGRHVNRVGMPFGRAIAAGIQNPGSLRQKLGSARKPIQAALSNLKEINARVWNKKDISSATPASGGIKALEFLTLLRNQQVPASAGKTQQAFTDFMGPTLEKLQKKTTVDRIHTGLKRTTVKDIASNDWIKETEGLISSRFAKSSDAKQFMESITNMNVGTHLFHRSDGHKIVGGGLDLSAFDPVKMMKRSLSYLSEAQWRVPLTKIKFSIGDITGLSDALAEKQDFHLFRNKPNFSLGVQYGNPEHAGKFTVGDLSDANDALFVNAGSKWGVFDGDSVKVVDTGRVLKYSRPSSKAKMREVSLINKQRMIAKLGKTEAYKKIIDSRKGKPLFNNKFFNWLNDKGTALPGLAQRALRGLNAKFGGEKHSHMESIGKIFGPSNIDEHTYRFLPDVKSVLNHTSQVFSKILHDKDAALVLGEYSGSRLLKKDWAATLADGKSIRDKYIELGLTKVDNADDYFKLKPELHEAVAKSEAFPRQAEKDIVHKRLGIGSDMNSYDVARVNMADDVLNNHYWNELAGNGMEHPLVRAAGALRAGGHISEQEMKALKLHGKLSALNDQSMFKHTGSADSTFLTQKAVHAARTHAKDQQWDLQDEIRDYIANNNLRSPRVAANFENSLATGMSLFNRDASPYASVPKGLGGLVDYADNIGDTLGNILEEVSPLKRNPIKHMGLFGTGRYIAKNAAVIGLAWQGYRAADALVASTPLLDNTMMDDGITGFVADTVAKGRLGAARLSDLSGVTGMAKKLEGLMPKSTSTLPGVFAGAVAASLTGGGVGATLGKMAWGGVINRMAHPYLPDATKSYEELKEIYGGREEVAMRKSPTWLLGGTPWEGTKVAGFTPNWYVRAKSRWKETETMYGSALRKLIHEPIPLMGFNIGDVVDPYYMERLHYFDRPYPVTGEFGSEIPIVGKLIAPTLGRIIKPQKTMHQAFLADDWTKAGGENGPYNINNPPPTMQEQHMIMNANGSSARSLGGRTASGGTYIYGNNKAWADTAARQFLMDATNAAGLQGFLGRTALEKTVGAPKVIPTLETAGRMASMSRSYYDLNLGGMGVLTEPVRRLIEKPEYARYGQNPIPNMMPNWLPSQFLKGDPYSKILRGELRLPGKAYQATHTNVRQDMPGRASMVGGNFEHIVQYFTGLLPPTLKEQYDILETGTEMHGQIQDQLSAEGLLVSAEAFVIDAKNDITGHVDAVIRDGRGGGGKRALEIKTINEKGFAKLDGPKYQHVGQLNFYLRQLKMKEGTIMYVMRDNPAMVKTFDVRYSKSRWEKDLAKLQQARQTAADMMQQGVGDKYGFSYSWLDRLKILSDVAPTSTEFKEAKLVVEEQIKNNLLSEKDNLKYRNALKNRQTRIRKYELYPLRFKGKIMSPDTERNIQSINENIKAAAEYSLPERVIGAAWEQFTNTNFFAINKMMHVKDPLEHYKNTRLYGKEFKPWDEPYRAWIEPLGRGLASKTDPFTGALGWATTGFVVGGGPLGVVGGAIGVGYGAVNGMVRKATGSNYIPGMVEEQREIEAYFDAAKYEKNQRLSMLSNGATSEHFHTASQATLTAFNSGEGGNVGNLFRATSTTEKPYIEAWLKERDPSRRREILGFIPSNLGKALQTQWGRADQMDETRQQDRSNSAQLATGATRYKFDAAAMDPSVKLEDVKLKTLEAKGYDAHEFGLGWNEQQLRMMNYDNAVHGIDINRRLPTEANTSNINQGQIRMAIIDQLRNNGLTGNVNVYINHQNDEVNVVNIILKRDRSQAIINSLTNRDKWM